MTQKRNVAVLGATGAVGQRMIAMLTDHPHFRISALCASERSEGKTFGEATDWRMPVALAPELANMKISGCSPDAPCDFAFSALPRQEATSIERAFAAAGKPIVSNAASFRMEADVPLVIPEINPDHMDLIEQQKRARGWQGFIVTNPNCSTIGLALPLKALDDAFGVTKVQVVTMQALSGAGFPGPAALAINDNVVPYIAGEEEKIEEEPQKILGRLTPQGIRNAEFVTSASCHRVAVTDGHLETVSVSFARPPAGANEIFEALEGFRGAIHHMGLHSAPARPIIVRREDDRPQPLRDRMEGNGMSVVVGRVRVCPVMDFKMEVLSHNTIRGAAGAAILNAELLLAQNRI